MKAVILAGGEGTRLRPISAECPKPMVSLFDKPVMAYGVEYLKKHGFTDITATLSVMPQKIKDTFGNGEEYGVRMSYNIEQEPLGTAGGVRAALSDIPEGVTAVLSGDAVTDFDLTAALAFHRKNKADATLLLSKQKKLLEYGLVMLDDRGAVTRFIEKPSWNQVYTNTVNTGIYLLSPQALSLIPTDRPYDFARDLFPDMLARGMCLMGYTAEGYWCDMGDSDAFLSCCCDILDGHIQLALPPAGKIPPDVHVTPPCYVGEDTVFGKGVRIGPYAIIGRGSALHDRTVVEAGVVDGAILETGARCEGAFVGRGSVLGAGTVAREGAVVGERVTVGTGVELLETARIWPRKEIASYARISGPVSKGSVQRERLFEEKGRIRGLPHADISPEVCMKIGAAAARTAPGETAVSRYGGEAANICAQALTIGLASAGNRVLETDARNPGCAGFCGGLYHIPLSIFVEQNERDITLYFFEKDGLPPQRTVERKIEALTLRGDVPYCDPERICPTKTLSGLGGLYAYTAALPPRWVNTTAPAVAFHVNGQEESAENLRRALTLTGTPIGGEVFGIDRQGLALSARLRDGTHLNMARLTGLVMLCEILCGGRELAIPGDAPGLLDKFAADLGVTLLREGRDGDKARSLLASQPFMVDPLCMAARLSYGCRALGLTLSTLNSRLPEFYITQGELSLEGEPAGVMKALVGKTDDAELYDGIRTRSGEGWVKVVPMAGKQALRIVAEAANAEMAGEIMVETTRKAREADSREKIPQKK